MPPTLVDRRVADQCCLPDWQGFVRFWDGSRTMVVEVVTMEQESSEEVFTAEMEARVCELVLGDRRHGLTQPTR
jgi:hypothetical protein